MIVSIIIVNYNQFGLLTNCLKSIEKNITGIDTEIIVIDNNSTEADPEKYFSNYPGVKLIRNSQNLGYARANNQGFEIAKGDYFLVLNNDTVFIENTILQLIDFSKKNNDNVIVGCKLLNADSSYQISFVDFDNICNLIGENLFLYKLFPNSRIFNKYSMNNVELNEPMEVDVVKGAFMFGGKDLFLKMKGFDERFYFYAEETDLCYRFKQQGGKVYYYPNFSILHIGGATTDTIPWFKFKNQSIAKIQIIQKHFPAIKKQIALFVHYFGLLLRVPLYFCMGLLSRKKDHFLKSYYYLKSLFIYPYNLFK